MIGFREVIEDGGPEWELWCVSSWDHVNLSCIHKLLLRVEFEIGELQFVQK